MQWTVVLFAVSVLAVIGAGIALARSTDALAEQFGLRRLVAGSILLAGATSLPELAIGLSAIHMELPDIAVGNLVGSCLFNLLILALADLFHRTKRRMLSQTAAGHGLSATFSVALTAIAGVAILTQQLAPSVGKIPFVASISIAISYAFGIRLVFLDQRISHFRDRLSNQEKTDSEPSSNSNRSALRNYIIAAVAILVAAPILTRSAGEIAAATRLGNTFVGTTLVALATSLPELVATITSVRMGSLDLAVGNIFGSNAFNILLLVPLDLVSGGSLLASVSGVHALTCFLVIVVTSIILLGQLYQAEKRILFVEPDAALVITLVVGGLWLVYIAN